MNTKSTGFFSLVDLLRERAEKEPERCAFVFLRDRGRREEAISYGELDRRARILSGALQDRGSPGDCVSLLYPPGLSFIVAFLGCLYGGRVPVPLYLPRAGQKHFRAARIIDDCGARLALTSRAVLPGLKKFLTSAHLSRLELFATEDLPKEATVTWRAPRVDPDTLAFLQYTSGSTSTPKGVKISHGNLMANEKVIAESFGTRRDDICLNWLPLYHDMGLIGTVLHALYRGFVSILMPSTEFIRRPIGWLEAISRYRATVCGAPNFAYELMLRKATAEKLQQLDLSSWRLAFNGAEPVRASTLKKFAEKLADVGFRQEAFLPCYGLAESTLFVSGGVAGRDPVVRRLDKKALEENQVHDADSGSSETRSLVGCGQVARGSRVVVVDPETESVCEKGRVGEIWISGPSVAQGYWGRPEETERVFHACPAGESEGTFLRTGDLGFLSGGDLFITGRLKDLLILRGRNHYPQDIETTVESSHPALRPGGGAAFSVEVEGEEQLAIVQEVERSYRRADLREVVAVVRASVAEHHELRAHAVVLVKPGGVPKTSSGKVRRSACREDFLSGRLPELTREEATFADPSQAGNRETDTRIGESDPGLASRCQRLIAEVLKVKPDAIHPREPLITFGVDSLMAIELEHRLENEHGLSVSIEDILNGATLESLIAEPRSRPPSVEIRSAQVTFEDSLSPKPLSEGQRALWFLHRLAPEEAAYHIVAAARVRSFLDVGALRRAVSALVLRHTALRTTFHALEGEPCRQIHEPARGFLEEKKESLDEAELREYLESWVYRPFDLEQGPLLRVLLLERPTSERYLALSLHHLVADFWSLSVLAQELGALYSRESGRGTSSLRSPTCTYSDFVNGQREHLATSEGERLLSYWRRQLAGAPDQLDLPSDRPRPPQQSFRGAAVSLCLDPGLRGALQALAKTQGATLFMTLLALFKVLLGRVSGQRDLLVGSPSTGRSRAEFAGCVGYFVNPLVLRADLSGEPSCKDVLGRVRRTVLDAFAHQDYPFALLAQELRPQRDSGRSPLFQTMFTWLKTPGGADSNLAAFALGKEGEQVELGDLVLESIALRERASQLDLSLRMAPLGDALVASIQYDSDLFDRTTARRFLGHLRELARGFVADSERCIFELCVLGAAERQQLVSEWSSNRLRETPEACLQQLFESQAERTPEAVAVVSGQGHMSFQDLDRRASDLAHQLQSFGVGPEDRVGIFLERSSRMVVGMMAVLKAGGAYVPLDVTYPRERVRFMLEDSETAVVLSEESFAPFLPTTVSILCLDRPAAREQVGDLPLGGARRGNLSHVIYTSGSTGRPKGVAIAHSSSVAFLTWASESFAQEELSGVLAATSICFDLSVFEIFLPLARGGTVVLVRDALELATLSAAMRVRLINTVPSAMAELLRLGAVPPSVRAVNLAGEPLKQDLVEKIFVLATPERVTNLYGPSEDTTYSTESRMAAGHPPPVTIGRPISGTRAFLVDRHQKAASIRVPSELYLGGAGLARGYLNRPALTAERFVPDPFASQSGARLYRTGDRARWLTDGRLDFLGRFDHQVKLRGFRIELGEIESVLCRHPEVEEGVVLARADGKGEARLAAYVEYLDAPPSASDLRAHVRERLPEYMVPSVFLLLDALPRNLNGKADRKALLDIEPDQDEREEGSPHSHVEELLAGIWRDLLGLKRVGTKENFFDLGGHSLKVTQLLSRLREVFQVELEVTSVFEAPTIARLAEHIDQALQKGRATEIPRITPLSIAENPPLSFAQQRLWFLDQLEPGSPLYNISVNADLEGCLRPAALEGCLREVIRRHAALRTTFSEEKGDPLQVIAARPCFSLPVVDLVGLPTALRQRESRRLSIEEERRPFDLTQGPLLRASLLRQEPDRYGLLLTMHHIISDGWSMGVLAREMNLLYRALSSAAPPLPALTVQYADFAHWQRRWLDGEVLESLLGYWRPKLAGISMLELSTDRPRPAVSRHRGASHRAPLSGELRDALMSLAQVRQSTLFMVVLTAFKVLLNRYSGQRDIAVGSPIANRTRQETEELIGFFVNTLVLRTTLSGDPAFRDLLNRVRQTTLEAYTHQDLPFERLVAELQPERSQSHTPLFQVMFAFQNAPLGTLNLSDVTLTSFEIRSSTAKFDLVLSITEEERGLICTWEYDTDLFDSATITRLGGHLGRVLAVVSEDPTRSISGLGFLARSERHQLLREWNDTRKDQDHFPKRSGEAFVYGLFEGEARSGPDRLALVSGKERLSYAELNRRANRLARWLQDLGVGPESRVGVCLDRSISAVVATLGILKAGGAYVALDPTYPQDRLAFMVEDAELSWIVTKSQLMIPGAEARSVCLDSNGARFARKSSENLRIMVEPAHLAYVMYTSGSTGRPKGVAIHHGSLLELVSWHREFYQVGAQDRATQIAGLSFDASVWESWPYLASGASLHLVEDETRSSPSDLIAWLVSRGITLSFLPTPLAESVMEETWPDSSLRALLTGGDKLRIWPRENLGFPVVNHYGPTENTVLATRAWLEPGETSLFFPPIGNPASNTVLYVESSRGKLQPSGVPGELFIAGTGLARGYLGRPALTAKRFTPDPRTPQPGERNYKTGDLVRWHSTGELEFLGRNDAQVKVRGFRIELDEIEAVLREHPGVREAAVVAREARAGSELPGGGVVLAAFVVGQETETPTEVDLSWFLKKKLPEYMVPAIFVFMEALPVTPNGKLDRHALVIPDEARQARTHIAPRTPVERRLAASFAEVLQVADVGVKDNFFQLGGHSLLATQLISRIRGALRVELPLRTLFDRPTVESLAESIEVLRRTVQAPMRPMRPISRQGKLPLSFAQQRLWFLEQMEPGSYNVGLALSLAGPLQFEALRSSFEEIVHRHEVLRTHFATEEGVPYQMTSSPRAVTLPLVDLGKLDSKDRESESEKWARETLRRPFDLARGAPLRVCLLRLGARQHTLATSLHHIAFDGWSFSVLTREMKTLYHAFSNGISPRLPELPIQYADFAHWQRERLRGELLESLDSYWRQQLSGARPLQLPSDASARSRSTGRRGAHHPLEISGSLTEELKALSRRSNTSLFTSLLAVFNILLSWYTGQDDIVLGSETAARNQIEVEPLIGFFINILVLRTSLEGDPDFQELLSRVRQIVLEAQANQDLPFEKLPGGSNQGGGRKGLVRVIFAMENVPMPAYELAGLEVSPLVIDPEPAKFDLLLDWSESRSGLRGVFKYDPDVLKASSIDRLGEHYKTLLSAIVGRPTLRVEELKEMLDDAESQRKADQKKKLAQATRSRLKKLRRKTIAV